MSDLVNQYGSRKLIEGTNLQNRIDNNVVPLADVPLVKGWHYSIQEFKDAWKKGELVTGIVETSNVCNLMCEYCFRDEIKQSKKERLANELNLEERLGLIDQLSELNVKSLYISGAGEPTIDPLFKEQISYMVSKDIHPFVFTNGLHLSDDLISFLYDSGASVMLKLNSFDEVVQDGLAQRNGYTKKRNETLQKLIQAGFNKREEGKPYATRLAIDSIVCQQNKDEVLDIFTYCRDNNIMPEIKTFIPAGRTKDRNDMEISFDEFEKLSKRARKIDKEKYGINYDRTFPFFGGLSCVNCSPASIYTNIEGNIYECVAQEIPLGNIKGITIKEAMNKLKDKVHNPGFGCPAKIKYYKESKQI